MNSINQAILQCLRVNSRMSWQQIGKKVHLTGQAVAARVQQMQDQGIISGYTIKQNNLERHFITMFMQVNRFEEFEQYLQTEQRVESAHKVTGEGCYQLIAIASTAQELESLLNVLLKYGKYRVSTAIRCVK